MSEERDSSSDQSQALVNYAALLAKVDEKFGEIQAKAEGAMKCASGCHQCCLPGLTVNGVEAAHLRAHLAAHPEAVAELAAVAAENPHGGLRCSFLDGVGRCAIYAARPIVCRSHGAPIEVKAASGVKRKDVCPLNFVGTPLATLAPGMVLNLDLLNTLLALIDAQYRGKSGPDSADPRPRTPLTLAALGPGH